VRRSKLFREHWLSRLRVGLVQLSFFNIVSVFNVLLGGGLLAVWLKYKVQIRSADRTDFELVVGALRQQRADDLERIEQLERRLEDQEAEIHGLRIARDLDPFPNWVVDLHGTYKFVNREFERYFLEPRKQTYRDVVGKRHADIWPKAFCRTVETLNAAAAQRPDGTARAVAALDISGLGNCEVTVHKFPVRFKGAIVAMAGYITSIEPRKALVG